ncbi:MAG: hypothetical protein ACP6IU_13095 [Candidatus Asgardarchaeia archaeon]
MKIYGVLLGLLIFSAGLVAFNGTDLVFHTVATVSESRTIPLYTANYSAVVSVSDPYDGWVHIELKLAWVNETMASSALVSEMAALTAIIITYDYGSKYFTLEKMGFYNTNKENFAHDNITADLYFPIREPGSFTLNITFEILDVVVLLLIIESFTLPYSLQINVNSNNLSVMSLVQILLGIVIIQSVLIAFLFYKLKTKRII